MTRVLVVDDHALFRQGLCRVLSEAGIDVVGEAGDGAEAVRMARRLGPDVVLMDLHMPVRDGVEATRDLAPEARVLILTVSDEDEDLFRALDAGAQGYLLKDTGPEALVGAVRSVAEGSVVLSPEVSKRVLAAVRRPRRDLSGLSGREKEVLALVARGRSNLAIAKALGISEHTVKTYIERLFQKLDVSSRSEAAAYGADLSIDAADDRTA